jgi:hypothetical protein
MGQRTEWLGILSGLLALIWVAWFFDYVGHCISNNIEVGYGLLSAFAWMISAWISVSARVQKMPVEKWAARSEVANLMAALFTAITALVVAHPLYGLCRTAIF